MNINTLFRLVSLGTAVFALVSAYNINSAKALVADIGLTTGVQTQSTSSGSVNSSTRLNVNTNIVDVGVNATTTSVTTSQKDEDDSSSDDITVSTNSNTSIDTSSDNEVSVEYKRPSKLFGFISVNLTEKATVHEDSNGNPKVKVSKSWWSIFATDDTQTEKFSNALKARIQSQASVSANGSAGLTASEKEMYVSEINAAAEATYGASVQ